MTVIIDFNGAAINPGDAGIVFHRSVSTCFGQEW
jgi:hypothetical protein